jgi:hypothetical protein
MAYKVVPLTAELFGLGFTPAVILSGSFVSTPDLLRVNAGRPELVNVLTVDPNRLQGSTALKAHAGYLNNNHGKCFQHFRRWMSLTE